MFKRVRWAGIGAALGVGTVTWARHRLRVATEQHRALAASRAAAGVAAGWRANVRDALTEGRRAMDEREAELRSSLDPAERARARSGDPAVGPGRPAAIPVRARELPAASPGRRSRGHPRRGR